MPNRDQFPTIFAQLRAIMRPYEPGMRLPVDTSLGYSLDAPPSPSQPEGIFFGGVAIRKNYVSFYLMPVYTCPPLLESLSERLRKRMQGKACFNFTEVLDDAIVEELARLTRQGHESYREASWLP
jgi:hypothetical protein